MPHEYPDVKTDQMQIKSVTRKELEEMIRTLPDGRMITVYLGKEGDGDG